MPHFKPTLRWFQFRLRSLLVLTLVVALWLGWELRQTDLIGGHIAAIRDIGGEVEFESSPWSLLRYVDPSTFGRRAVSVELPIARAGEALGHLAKLPALREVRLMTDGTVDLYGMWAELSKTLPGRRIMPIAKRDEKSERSMLALPRFLAKMEAQVPSTDPLLSMIREQKLVNDSQSDDFIDSWARSEFHLVPLPDGSIAEILLTMDWSPFGPQYETIAIMLVRDKFVDAKGLWSGRTPNETGVASVGGQAVIEDIDGDGYLDAGFAFEAGGPRVIGQPVVEVPGDSRAWNCIYRIEPSGFKPYVSREVRESRTWQTTTAQ